ncbi:MAG: class I SAM-dependent methyltransferase [Phycisphaerales bacterium]|nr:class I SAM-dependent methyltransferase [Phycisphaerales bacterium]
MGTTKGLIRRAIRASGFDVVRLDATRVGFPSLSQTSNGAGRSFFPRETQRRRFKPWPVPDDLKSNPEPWARLLCELYARPASWPACVSPETGMLIHAMVRNIAPRVVVETGTCHGASTIWMAAAMPKIKSDGDPPCQIHTFDNFEPPHAEWLANMPLYRNRLQKVRRRFTRCGFESMIQIHVGDSAEGVIAERESLNRAGGVQLAFIDGDHTPAGVRRDFDAVEPCLNIGGYILLHDVFPDQCNWTGPRWLADNINTIAAGRYESCNIYTAPLNYGVTLLRRVG